MGWFYRAADSRCGGSLLMRAFVALVALAGALGCSGGGPSSDTEGLEDLHPVSGSVSFEGKPTPGAIVMFFKADDLASKGFRIAGEVDEEGFFEMMTGVSAGALPGVKEGQYIVTVVWQKRLTPWDKDSDMIDLIPEKYGDAKSSTLRAQVKAGDNVLDPFALVLVPPSQSD
jgi:hypothetical protein